MITIKCSNCTLRFLCLFSFSLCSFFLLYREKCKKLLKTIYENLNTLNLSKGYFIGNLAQL